MKRKRITSQEFSSEERNHWRNLEVNLDSFSNRWEDLYQDNFFEKLEKLPDSLILEILNYFNIDSGDKKNPKTKLSGNRRVSILTYCIISFTEQNPKILSEIFQIPYLKKKPNILEITREIFRVYKNGTLNNLFLFILRRKLGKGKFQYNFLNEFSEVDYEKIVKLMPNVASQLKRRERKHKLYNYRFGYKGTKGEWLFLLLKETEDKVHLAIPNNISMVKGVYKLIAVNPKNKLIDINTSSKDEAFTIRNYLNEKLKNPYTHRKDEHDYKPADFFDKILTVEDNSEIVLIGVNIKSDETALKASLSDPNSKNDIVPKLLVHKSKGMLNMKDFSEFSNLIFLYKNLRIKIDVIETTWGIHRLNLIDKRISSDDLSSFKTAFKKKYGVELDTWLKPSGELMDYNRILSKILDKKTIPVYTITDDIDAQLWGLFQNGIISKTQHSAKRICVNPKCRYKTWSKDSCPRCGNNLKIDGDFVEVKTNQKGIFDYTFKAIKAIKGLKVTRDKIQIANKKYPIIEIMNKAGEDLTVYISKAEPPSDFINHYDSNGLPLLVILTHYKTPIYQSIVAKNFECCSLVDLYFNYTASKSSPNKEWLSTTFNKFIGDQKAKWKEKLLHKGLNSYTSITNKPDSYSDQNFETDIFNLLHEIFYVAYKLGGSFTGIKAPDAILSIRNYRTHQKKFCMSYDCKYSMAEKGYQLQDGKEKHRHYIRILNKNRRVRFYGNLKVHAIISQNMDMNKYESFYTKLIKGFKWNGLVLFIDEKVLVQLYDFYRKNNEQILAKPDVFYTELYTVFSKFKKAELLPYPQITENRIRDFYKKVLSGYEKAHIKLVFDRSDFNAPINPPNTKVIEKQ